MRGGVELFTLDYRDSKPIYEQIKESIRRMIHSGILSEDNQLPSVRNLASQLSINPNTIQRAYRELEAEGYLYSVPGKGSFVRKSESLYQLKEKSLLEAFDRAAEALLDFGIATETLHQHLDSLKGGNKRD